MDPEAEEFRSHLALAAQMLRIVTDAHDVDMDNTCLDITLDGQTAKIPLSAMLSKWDQMTGPAFTVVDKEVQP